MTFGLLTSACDGSNPSYVSSLTCTVPLLALRSAPFNLAQENTVVVQVVATNFYGDSETSNQGGSAKIWLVPEIPLALTNDTVTNKDLVGITWSDGLNAGGTPVIDFRVSWDKSSGNWEVL